MSGRFLRFAVLIVLLLLTAQMAQPYITRFAATTPRLVVPRGNLSEAERATIALFEQVSVASGVGTKASMPQLP
jgi:hypothetical protein